MHRRACSHVWLGSELGVFRILHLEHQTFNRQQSVTIRTTLTGLTNSRKCAGSLAHPSKYIRNDAVNLSNHCYSSSPAWRPYLPSASCRLRLSVFLLLQQWQSFSWSSLFFDHVVVYWYGWITVISVIVIIDVACVTRPTKPICGRNLYSTRLRKPMETITDFNSRARAP